MNRNEERSLTGAAPMPGLRCPGRHCQWQAIYRRSAEILDTVTVRTYGDCHSVRHGLRAVTMDLDCASASPGRCQSESQRCCAGGQQLFRPSRSVKKSKSMRLFHVGYSNSGRARLLGRLDGDRDPLGLGAMFRALSVVSIRSKRPGLDRGSCHRLAPIDSLPLKRFSSVFLPPFGFFNQAL